MIETDMITLAEAGGRKFEAHLASSAPGAKKPAILILSEMFGLNDPMRNLAGQYAERGHCAIVPDVFWRSHVSGGVGYDEKGFEIAWQRVHDFDYDGVGKDLRLAADALRRQPGCNGKVVALGFCMGGRLAFIAAARSGPPGAGRGVDAAIGLYGLNVSKHLHEFDKVKVPMHFHYGDKDQHVPPAEVEAVEKGMKANPNIVIYRYAEAGHSFFNKARPTYDPAAAAVAAKRIDALLASL